MNIKIKILFFFLCLSANGFAQKGNAVLKKGNELYQANNYVDAEADYRLSASRENKNPDAVYNLGTSIYRQKQSAEAQNAFAKAIKLSKTYAQKHRAFHNLGNALMNDKNYQGAVEAYKNALRNDPADEQTRYNYALAKKMLKENPPKDDKDKKDKDKKDKDKKDQDKKDQDKKDQEKKDQDKKDQEKKDQDKKEGDQKDDPQKPKPEPGGISPQRLENLLDAVNNEEKKIQDKVNLQKVKPPKQQTEKDW